MADPKQLTKASLTEVSWNEKGELQVLQRRVEVQFNPESLKVSLSNQKAGGDQKGGSAIQHVGSATSKLSFDLWFDVSGPQALGKSERDVRNLTKEVAYFITPQKPDGKVIAPGVRFAWGTFRFDGIMESLNETLEYFSEDGRPLRAQLSVSLSRQEIQYFVDGQRGRTPPGTRPLTTASESSSVQSLAGTGGRQDQWQQAALRNGIENPLRLRAGTVLDLRPPSAQAGGPSMAMSSASLGFSAPAAAGIRRPPLPSASASAGPGGTSINLRS